MFSAMWCWTDFFCDDQADWCYTRPGRMRILLTCILFELENRAAAFFFLFLLLLVRDIPFLPCILILLSPIKWRMCYHHASNPAQLWLLGASVNSIKWRWWYLVICKLLNISASQSGTNDLDIYMVDKDKHKCNDILMKLYSICFEAVLI